MKPCGSIAASIDVESRCRTTDCLYQARRGRELSTKKKGDAPIIAASAHLVFAASGWYPTPSRAGLYCMVHAYGSMGTLTCLHPSLA